MSFRPWSTQLTQFHSLIGEFIISDNGMTLNHATGLLVNLQCCDHEDHLRIDHPQCAAFFIPPGDVLSQQYPKEKCMQFTRSIPCARCNLGPRLISNSVTAAQDLNSVYGVSTSMLNDRRTMADGCLKSQIINGHEMFAIERVNASGRYRCFNSKCELSPLDVRNVLAPTGLVFALLFHRNHNRHARKLAAIKPHWNDEKIFEEARKWNIAEYQHCVYNEYLETLIGTEFTDYFGILPKPIGQFSHYESDVQLKTIIEFQSTAGRHGHATLPEDISVIDFNSGSEVKYSLRQAELFERIFYDGLVDGMLLAQIMKPAFETTPSVPFKSFVLNTDGLDLGALDIQRQRDHGIPGYIHYLEYCHNVEIECWEDLEQFIDLEDIEKLKEYYKYVEDLELYVGGHYERKIADAVVGPTFACIIGIQFHNAKYGDRFFYEHGGEISSFSIEQIKEIKTKSSFASLLCKNTDLEHVLPDPFRIMSHTNNFVPCSEFDDIDYKL